MDPEIAASVLLATYRRCDTLRTTLDSFAALAPASFGYEIIVVDNAGETAARNLVESYRDRVPVQYLSEPKPGKNSALLRDSNTPGANCWCSPITTSSRTRSG